MALARIMVFKYMVRRHIFLCVKCKRHFDYFMAFEYFGKS